MRYKIPPDHEVLDLLTDAEYDNAPTDRARIQRGRAKAWAMHRAKGPTGQLRDLAQGAVGDSVLFREYVRSAQISALTASVGISEGAQFQSRIERSLTDGEVVGVRVTLVGLTR